MSIKVNGSCLCEKIKFVLSGPLDQFHLCHCSRCRKSTGSAHASIIFAKPESIEWVSGTEFIKRFDLPEAKRFAKCFCTECGSAVPHTTGDGQLLLIPAGLLEDDPVIRPQDKIFWKDRAEWHDDNAMTAPCFDSYPT